MNLPILLILAVATGILVGLIGTGVLESELKSVEAKTQANSYVTAGSLNIEARNDIFLYSTEEKKEKPKKNTEENKQ